MSYSWDELTAPTVSDAISMKTVYGIPHNMRIIKLNNVGAVRATAENRSTYYQWFRFDLWQLVNGSPQYKLSRYVSGTFALGDPVYVEDNLWTLFGSGLYTYKITVYQTFPNMVVAEQSGGFADWIQIDPPPYQIFVPLVIK